MQDLSSGRYSAMQTALTNLFSRTDVAPLVYAAGHDHSLQVIKRPNSTVHYLVSGSAAKQSDIGDRPDVQYGTSQYGYMRLDFFALSAQLAVRALNPMEPQVTMENVYWCTITYDRENGTCTRPREE